MFALLALLAAAASFSYNSLRSRAYREARAHFNSTEELEAFLEWALGPGYGSALVSGTPERWNALHGDKFLMFGTDNVIESTRKMVEIYKAEMEL